MFKGAPPCHICNKRVYPMDVVVADEKPFHKTCMKCKACHKTLSLGNYASLNGVFYCKPHFKQLFTVKGNYSTGFGEKDPKARWQNDCFSSSRPSSHSPSSVRSSHFPTPSPSPVVSPGRLKMERVQSVRFTPTQQTDYDAKLPKFREADDALDLQNKKTLNPDEGTSLEQTNKPSPSSSPSFPSTRDKEREEEIERALERIKKLERENKKLKLENAELKGNLKEKEELLGKKAEREEKIPVPEKLKQSTKEGSKATLVSESGGCEEENQKLKKKIKVLETENAQKEKKLIEEQEKREEAEKESMHLRGETESLEKKCQKIEESLVFLLSELVSMQKKLSKAASDTSPCSLSSPASPSSSSSSSSKKKTKKVGGLAAMFEQKALEKENDAKRASLRIPAFRKNK